MRGLHAAEAPMQLGYSERKDGEIEKIGFAAKEYTIEAYSAPSDRYLDEFLGTLALHLATLTSAFYAPARGSGAFASTTTGLLLRALHLTWVLTSSFTAFSIAITLLATAPESQKSLGPDIHEHGI